jgi:TonB family protein
MKIKLNTYKILFRLLDILSNSKLLHKMVINRKIYLGASIISLSIANSGCSSSKMNASINGDTGKGIQNNRIPKGKTDSCFSDVPKLQNLDTSVMVIMCYKSAYIEESNEIIVTDNKLPDSLVTVPMCYLSIDFPDEPEENSTFDVSPFTSNTIAPDFNGENVSRINDLVSNIRRPKETKKVTGTVFVEFTITVDGIIKNVRIKKGINPFLDEEVVRVVRNMHYWIWPINYAPESEIEYIVPVQILSHEN